MDKSFEDQLGEALLRLYRADRYMYNVAARLKILPGDSIPLSPQVLISIHFSPITIISLMQSLFPRKQSRSGCLC